MAKDPNTRAVTIPAGEVELAGDLTVPEGAQGMVLFAQGSGSSLHSPRNQLSSPAAGRFRNQPRGYAMSVTGFCQGLFAQIATGGAIRACSGRAWAGRHSVDPGGTRRKAAGGRAAGTSSSAAGSRQACPSSPSGPAALPLPT